MNHPCENNGSCTRRDGGLVCECPIHYTGEYCGLYERIETSTHYDGYGYTELNRSALVNSPEESDISMQFVFSTTEPNGLIAWYGQKKGESFLNQDFVALAVVDGFLEYHMGLNGYQTKIKNSNIPVNDGARHTAVLTRNGNAASLELDNFTLYGETASADKRVSHMPGNVFIGKGRK